MVCLRRASLFAIIFTLQFSLLGLAQNPSTSPSFASTACGKPVCTWNPFGPRTFARSTGALEVFSASFNILNPNTQYTLQVTNGGVASAAIFLNGVQILGESDFDPNITTLNRVIQLQLSNSITVHLASKPGSSLTITVIGVDNDLPAIAYTESPLPNQFGWNNSDVDFVFFCSDQTSGIFFCSPATLVKTEGIGQIVNGTAVDLAGNSMRVSIPVNVDRTPPTIAAQPSPSPNSAGWNNTPVSVGFNCSDTLSGVLSCPSTETIRGEGENQVVSGTAEDKAFNTASASVSLNIDLTPPTLDINSPVNGAAVASPSLQITGSAFDALSGLAGVTCNGAAAVLSGTSFSCNTKLVAGANAVQVQATDVAGNETIHTLNVTFNAAPATPPKAIFLTPSTASIVVGQTRAVSLVGDIGQIVLGASYTISDPTIANLSSDDPLQLTARSPGSATLTANFGAFSASMTLNVYAGPSLPIGTAIWAVDPLPGDGFVETFFPANPVNPGDPDVYSVEGNQTLRAFTRDGRQLWVAQIRGVVNGPSTAPVGASALSQSATAKILSATAENGHAANENSAASQDFGRLSLDDLRLVHKLIEPLERSHLAQVQKGFRHSPAVVRTQALTATSSTSLYRTFTILSLPMNDGGTVSLEFHLGLTLQNPNYDSLVKTDSAGNFQWQYDSHPGGFALHAPAVGPDNTVYAIESYVSVLVSPFSQAILGTGDQLVALDGATGTPKFLDPLPAPQCTLNGQPIFNGLLGCFTFLREAPLSVMPDGTVQFVWGSYIRTVVSTTSTSSLSEHDALQLYKVQPDGTTATLPITQFDLDSSNCLRSCGQPEPFAENWFAASVIPDGSGGTLASWFDNLAVTTNPADGDKITHFDSSGNANTFVVPLTRAWGVSGQDGQNLVLGENAAFATDSVSVTAFDINSGAVLWQFIPGSQDSIQLLAADDPGGVTVLDFDSNTGLLSNEVAFDAGGNSTITPLNSALQFASSFYAATLQGISEAQQVQLLAGLDFDWAMSPWDTVPNDRASDPKITVTLKSYQVEGAAFDSTIFDQVNQAKKVWWTKAKINLDWDGKTTTIPDQSGALLDFNASTCSFLEKTVGTSTGSNLVFLQTIPPSTSISGVTPGPVASSGACTNPTPFGNLSAISRFASGNVVAHEIGHQFQLPHVNFPPSNLMCGTVCFGGSGLNADQVSRARQGAKKWARR